MRIDVNLEAEAYSFATYYARARGLELGEAVSELLLRAEQAPALPSPHVITNSRGLLVRAKGDRVVTPEMVKELSEDDLTE